MRISPAMFEMTYTHAKVGLDAGSTDSSERVRASMSPVKNCNIKHGSLAMVKQPSVRLQLTINTFHTIQAHFLYMLPSRKNFSDTNVHPNRERFSSSVLTLHSSVVPFVKFKLTLDRFDSFYIRFSTTTAI